LASQVQKWRYFAQVFVDGNGIKMSAENALEAV
jgi:hypothetical protein